MEELKIQKANKKHLKVLLNFDPLVGKLLGRYELHVHSINNGNTYIAFKNEQLIGFIIFNYQLFGNAFIELLQIDKEFRGKGYGSMLIKYVESICETEKLFISTNKSNEPMNKLLSKLGYLPSGHLENINEEDWDYEMFFVKFIKSK
jgi:ribosomal protein S18 acetylase RimI-like enzyme